MSIINDIINTQNFEICCSMFYQYEWLKCKLPLHKGEGNSNDLFSFTWPLPTRLNLELGSEIVAIKFQGCESQRSREQRHSSVSAPHAFRKVEVLSMDVAGDRARNLH